MIKASRETIRSGIYKGWEAREAKEHYEEISARASAAKSRHERAYVYGTAYLELTAGLTTTEKIKRTSWINSKDKGVIRFDRMWPWQLEVLAYIEECKKLDVPAEIEILKPRQLGFTTLIENAFFHDLAHNPYWNALVISHELKATKNIARIPAFTHQHCDYPPASTWTRTQGGTYENGSHYFIETAGGEGVGRSWTFHLIHISEAAFCPNDYDMMAGVQACLPEVGFYCLIQETTANGEGNQFWDVWERAERGENDYRCFFYPWFTDPRYAHKITSDGERRLLEDTLDDEEKQGIELWGWTVEQIKWRRHRINTRLSGSVDRFHQEYPSTPEESIMMSGRPVFDMGAYRRARAVVSQFQPVFAGDILEV